MKDHQMEDTNVDLFSLDSSSFFMLAAGVASVGALSNRLDPDASVPHHRFNNEWTFCTSLCTDHASRENSAWTVGKVKNRN